MRAFRLLFVRVRVSRVVAVRKRWTSAPPGGFGAPLLLLPLDCTRGRPSGAKCDCCWLRYCTMLSNWRRGKCRSTWGVSGRGAQVRANHCTPCTFRR